MYAVITDIRSLLLEKCVRFFFGVIYGLSFSLSLSLSHYDVYLSNLVYVLGI